MKLADPMQDLSGFDPRRGAGKGSIETPAGTSPLFAGILSTVASRSEPDDASGAKAEPGKPTVDVAVGSPDPASAEATAFGPRSSRTARDDYAVDSPAGKGKTRPQIGMQLSDLAQPTSASTASTADKTLKTGLVKQGAGDNDSALGLVNMLLSNSSFSSSRPSRNATPAFTQRPSTFQDQADAAVAKSEAPDIIQPIVSTTEASHSAEGLSAADVREKRETKSDAPRDLVAMILSGLGTQSFSPLQEPVDGNSGSEPHAVEAMTRVDTVDPAFSPEISLGPHGVPTLRSGDNGAVPVATINATTLTVQSVSAHLGSTVALSPADVKLGVVSAVPPATSRASDQQTAETGDFANLTAEVAAQFATARKPEAPTQEDGKGKLIGLHPELLISRVSAANNASLSEHTPTRSRVTATDAPLTDKPALNDEGVRESSDGPIERSQKSESASRADHDPPAEPTVKSLSRPTELPLTDTPRQGRIVSSISRIAAAVTDVAQRSASSSATSTVSLASARTLTLRMDQADLGPISIRMHLTGRSLELHLTASNHETVAFLQRERETLTSALGDNSYRLHSLVIQGDGATSTTASRDVGTGAGGQGARADSHDPTPQEGNRNNEHAGSDRQRRQGDKPDASHSLGRNSRGSLFV